MEEKEKEREGDDYKEDHAGLHEKNTPVETTRSWNDAEAGGQDGEMRE
jgi:hypothetical protein